MWLKRSVIHNCYTTHQQFRELERECEMCGRKEIQKEYTAEMISDCLPGLLVWCVVKCLYNFPIPLGKADKQIIPIIGLTREISNLDPQ